MSPTTTITALMRSVLLLAAAWSLAGCAATGPKHGGRDAPNVVLRGVTERFSVRSWLFHVEPLQPGCDVLLEGAAVDSELTDDAAYPPQPVAWSRASKSASGDRSRVFHTSLGHPEDFETRSVRTLFVNAVFWSIGWEARIPADGCAADPMYPYIAPETRGRTAP